LRMKINKLFIIIYDRAPILRLCLRLLTSLSN
jgi:hypothetical protein